jgi:hypothetical protein
MSNLRQHLVDKWYGLRGDNPIEGSLTKATNVTVEEGGAFLQSRLSTSAVLGPIDCAGSRGFDSIHELIKTDGDKFVIIDAVSVNGSGNLTRKAIGAENISTTNDLEFDSVSTIVASVSVSGKPSYATARNRAFRVDGNSENIAISALNDYSALGVVAPVSISASSASGGSLIAGDYRVYVKDVKKDTNDASYIHISNPSDPVDVTVSGNAIQVSVTKTDNADVTHKWIYRTLYDGQYENAYYAAEIANITTNVTLTAADSAINTQTGIYIIDVLGGNSQMYGVPPKADFVLYAQDRMFYGVKAEDRLYYSEVGYPESVGTTSYTVPFERGDGDELIGGLAFQNALLIFKNYKFFIVDLLGEDYPQNKLSSRLGCIDPRTIKATGSNNSAMWLSHEGVQLFSNGQYVNVTTGKIYTSILRDYILNGAEFIAEYYADRNQYHLFMFYRNSAGDEISSYRHLVFSLSSGEWTEFYDREDAGGGTYSQLASVASGILTDGKGKQVLVTASLEFDGTRVELKQWDVQYSDVGATLTALNTTPVGGNWESTCFLWGDTDQKFYIAWGSIGGSLGSGTGGIYSWDGSSGNSGFTKILDFSGYDTPIDLDAFVFGTGVSSQDPWQMVYDGENFYVCFDTTEESKGEYFVKLSSGGSGTISETDLYAVAELPVGNKSYLTFLRNQLWYDEDGEPIESPSVTMEDGAIFAPTVTADTLGEGGKWFEIRWTFESGYSVAIDFSQEVLAAYELDPNYEEPPTPIYPVALFESGNNYNVLCYGPYNVDGTPPTHTLFCMVVSKYKLNILRDQILANWNESLSMSWQDPEFHIQTAFTDYGAPHLKKTLQKIHIPIDATTITCGLVHCQPDFTEQNYIGITDSAATPRYTSSPIVHEGATTVDTDDVFASTEQTRIESMGVNVSGKKIRMAIRGGTAGTTTTQAKIYPPIHHIRVWGQKDKDKRG